MGNVVQKAFARGGPAPAEKADAPSPLDPSAAPSWSGGWGLAAVVALAVAGFASSFTYVWDCDVFWHLASGQWMLRHGKILGIDPFSIDPMPQWVNVHWLFQLIIASLHALGGFEALSILKASLAAATLGAFALALRKHVPPAWLILCGLGMLITIAGRVRVRPEAFTLLFLVLTIVLTDSVRRGAPAKRLWWLVPILLAWVNMHGIYILGLAVIWAAIVGGLAERWVFRNRTLQGNLLTQAAILPVLAASIVCFLTPWPVDAAIQPLLLWTRVSGENDFYTYAVSELYPAWRSLDLFIGPIAMVAATIVALLVNFTLGLVAHKPRVPLAHVMWLVAFTVLAALAKRNVALLGPACGFLLAWHGKDILASVRSGKLMTSRLWPALTIIMLSVTLAQTASYATEYSFRKERTPFRFGAGLLWEEFPVALAQWLADSPAKGDILVDDFGDASSFIYYGSLGRPRPNRLMYMDGRLEAHDQDRFVTQHRIHMELGHADSAAAVALPRSVRFVIVRHNAPGPLTAMSLTPRFRLVRIDRTCAAFEDTQWAIRNGETDSLPPEDFNLAQFDQPLNRDGFVENTPARLRTAWRRNPISLAYRTGEMLLWLGQHEQGKPLFGRVPATRYRCTLMSVRYLDAADRENSQNPVVTAGMLAQASQQRAFQNFYGPSAYVPVNMDLARSLRVYRQLNMGNLKDENTRRFAVQRVGAMVLGKQWDAAAAAMTDYLNHLPSEERVRPRNEDVALRDGIRAALAQSTAQAQQVEGADFLEKAQALADPQVGLIDQAIAHLSAPRANLDAETQFRGQRLLGDLLLRKGLTEQARSAYQTIPAGHDDAGKSLRLALCEWADGNLLHAAEMLEALKKSLPASDPAAATAPATGRENTAAVSFYLADLLEVIGDYPSARKALQGVRTGDLDLGGLIDRLRLRLEER